MKQELKTLEVARIYESQGYFEEALEIYSFLDENESSDEVTDNLKRLGEMIKNQESDNPPEEKLSTLYKEWLNLMILEQRFENFKKIKSRH